MRWCELIIQKKKPRFVSVEYVVWNGVCQVSNPDETDSKLISVHDSRFTENNWEIAEISLSIRNNSNQLLEQAMDIYGYISQLLNGPWRLFARPKILCIEITSITSFPFTVRKSPNMLEKPERNDSLCCGQFKSFAWINNAFYVTVSQLRGSYQTNLTGCGDSGRQNDEKMINPNDLLFIIRDFSKRQNQ